MKKTILSLAVMVIAMMTTACTGTSGLAQAQNTGSTTQGAGQTIAGGLTSLLQNLVGQSTTLTQDKLVGTWQFEEPACVFESENLLSKAGGALAAERIKTQLTSALSRVGVTKGNCSFTFNADGTYTANLGGRTVNGKYTVNNEAKTVTMTYLAGIKSVTPKVSLAGNSLSILYESEKLLGLINGISALTKKSSNTALSTLSTQYDGMYLGFNLKK